ncbi:unnamed protein product [Plutella xylostella]|uniref:(diamondback moth) hypothetical protein n=1 Tax=Plutella xylostella TaxID=51655 RepID=A0A8S4GAT6_PLUXY|nr:unnamed protein product [Plutella xylostella]
MAATTKLKSKHTTVNTNQKTLELAQAIDETDEMKLKMLGALDKPESGDSLYPAELNAHLCDQLRMMTCENSELRKCVFTKDEEISQLNKTVIELNQRIRDIISGTGPAISSKSAGVISAKITDLCKQNRHLVAELEGYKTKNAALERKLMQLEILKRESEKLDVCVCKEEPIDVNSDELKDLNNKLAAVNKKLYESKNRNLELKNDILIATKILQQELGDKFTSIKELQKDLAGWKGRAQQIILLQSRINELEQKLNGTQKDLIDAKRKDQSQVIRDLEMKRKQEVDQAMKELGSLRTTNEELKKKLDAAKCRVRNLECDTITIRQKMQTFMEKSKHDDMLINEQRNKIKSIEMHYQDILKSNTGKMKKMQDEILEYKKMISNTDSKINAMMKQASEKSTKIEELRAQLLKYEECSLQSVFFTPMKTATDNEIQKLSELVKELNGRLTEERQKFDELDVENKKLKEQKRKFERKADSLKEQLQDLANSRKGSRMSKMSVNKFKGSETTIGQASTSKKDYAGHSMEDQTDDESVTTDELKFKLELAGERLKIMEDRLKMVEEEKQEDLNSLTEMIQTSKQLFHEALQILQKHKCVCS